MEWVETTARRIEEAKDKALDQLGVAEDDAEFEIFDEPKPGLFGRLRGEARVRARVRPTQARHKVDRRDRRPRKSEGGDAAPEDDRSRGRSVGRSRRSSMAAKAAHSTAKADGDSDARQPATDKEQQT